MSPPNELSSDELQSFLDELEGMAPRNPTITRIAYREVDPEAAINDAEPLGDDELETEEFSADGDTGTLPSETGVSVLEGADVPAVHDFAVVETGPVDAVDCGIVRLGETENGLVIALRATLVCDGVPASGQVYRSGPIYLRNDQKLRVLHQIGRHLGNENIFVRIDHAQDPPRLVAVKAGVADDAHQYGDRFRNWLERLVQRVAVRTVTNGIVLLDGALTLRTRDTPERFLHELASTAAESGNALVALSKQSRLLVRSRSIRFWLADAPNRACYRNLSPLMDRGEGAERVLGSLYAARFSPAGPTFRLDVRPTPGQTDREVLNQFYSSVLMRGGYPDILVRAHTFSYFTAPDVIGLQAQAGARYSLVPQAEVSLSGIFGPFGGRFK
jgi:hypothetical protein